MSTDTTKAKVMKREQRWVWRYLPDYSTTWHQTGWRETFDIAFSEVSHARLSNALETQGDSL